MAESGIFKVQDLVLVATPNSTQSKAVRVNCIGLVFKTDGVNFDIPDNSVQMMPLDEVVLTFEVRGCILGEQMLTNGKCKICPSGFYLLEVPFEPISCKSCKTDQSYCLGGTNIFPKEGYWRSSNVTDNLLACINPEACLGGNA